ncbi:MAG: TIGR04255 family protein [Deltaproteobacteria bacterium]|nr:TIGR04255 family protein [Deltaproteobacteria bacterium]
MKQPATSSPSLSPLPSYKKPPVDEVVCGVRFLTPEQFRIPHIGLLWDKFRSDYPIIQHAPPLVSAQGEIIIDAQSGIPVPRIWLINKSDDQLVQFQVDRFYFNWRRRKDTYPRYTYVISKFENVWDTIIKFFNEFEFGEFKPIECELSYTNHIPKGEGWNTINDIPKIFSDFVWNQVPGRFLPNPENVAWQSKFALPANKGHLTVNLKQAVRAEDKVPLFVFELTARWQCESNDKKVIREWFDVAHEWIVRGFTDITSSDIQRTIWEREENA